jgi:hypothetical protein
MKNLTLRLTLIYLAAILILGGCAKRETFDLKSGIPSLEQIMLIQPDCDNPVVTDLVAGKNFIVGSITAMRNGDEVTVTYQITDPLWSITEIHLAIGEIPVTRNNNPKVGNFGINEVYKHPVKSKSFSVELAWNGPVMPIAAHAVVVKNLSLEQFNGTLPDGLVDFHVSYPGTESYFSTTLIQEGITETYPGWCIDTDHGIYSGVPYTAELVSTYELAGMGLVEFPENLDKVNWIINQDFAGQVSLCGDIFTFGDVQRAIWELIEDNQSESGLGDWSQCRVDEILADALESGNAFEPSCEQEIAVALVPYDINGNPVEDQITITQITIIEKILDCVEDNYLEETAWGDGTRFNDRNWATRFYICN